MSGTLPVSVPQAISDALACQGMAKRKDQARALGMSPTLWSRYLNGHRSPQCAVVQGWMAALDEQGIRLTLTWDSRAGASAD